MNLVLARLAYPNNNFVLHPLKIQGSRVDVIPMQTLPSLTRFSDPTLRSEMLSVIRHGAWVDPSIGFQAAWHLRQTNTNEAVDISRALLLTEVFRAPYSLEIKFAKGYLDLVLAESCFLFGNYHEAKALVDEAVVNFGSCGSSQGMSDVRWLESFIASELGQQDLRTVSMTSSVSFAEVASDLERACSGRLALACFAVLEQGQPAFNHHLGFAKPFLEDPSAGVRALAHCFMSHGHLSQGKFVEGLEHSSRASSDGQVAGQLRRAILDATNVGFILADLNELDACVDQAQDVLALARLCGWPSVTGSSLTGVAQALNKIGRHNAASTMAEEAIKLLKPNNSSRAYLLAMHTAAECSAFCGDLLNARIRYQYLVQSKLGDEAIELQRYALLGLARIESQEGNLAESQRFCAQALDFARQSSDVIIQVDALRLMAQLHCKLENHPDALQLQGELDAVSLLRQAVLLTDQNGEYPTPVVIMEEFSQALESGGHHVEALRVLRKAMASVGSEAVRDAAKKGVALEVRFKTERALADAEFQRKAAEAEAVRATDLEALNSQLQESMAALLSTQNLLIQRNDQLNLAYSRISDLSLTDPLTGLRNRRFLTQVIDGAVAQCLRSYRPSVFGDFDPLLTHSCHDIVFFMLDIDHFKSVNDQHGHATGDSILVQLKDRLRTVTREQDYLVRWGGEEFLVAVRDIDRREAPLIAERLRLCVESAPFPIGKGIELKKTVSIGFAAFPIDQADPTAAGWESAVQIADARLYSAKRSGRNCWVGDSGMHVHFEQSQLRDASICASKTPHN